MFTSGWVRMNQYILTRVLLLCPEPPGLSSERSWRTDTTSTVNWSIFSRSISALDTPTPVSGNGWSTSTETLTAPTWDTLTCSTTSPWLRTRAKRVSASTWWRRCFSHVDRLQTNLTMPKPHWSEPWILFPGCFCRLFMSGHSTWFSTKHVPTIRTITLKQSSSFAWPCQHWTDCRQHSHNIRLLPGVRSLHKTWFLVLCSSAAFRELSYKVDSRTGKDNREHVHTSRHLSSILY